MNKLYKSTIINYDHCDNTYKCPHVIMNKLRNEIKIESDI